MKMTPFEEALVAHVRSLRHKKYDVSYKITDTGYGLVMVRVKSPTQEKLDRIGEYFKGLAEAPECHVNFVTWQDGYMQAIFSNDEIDSRVKAERIALARELGYSDNDIERVMAQEKAPDVHTKLLALEMIYSGKRQLLSIADDQFDAQIVPILYEGYSRCIGEVPGASDFDIMANAGMIIKQWVAGVKAAAATQH